MILVCVPGSRPLDGELHVRFGPDGFLYVGAGDGHGESRRAQGRGSLGGKLLRITTDGVPAGGSRFPGSAVFLLGVRDTQAFDFSDAQTLVVADHGPSGDTGRSGRDEVGVARASANLGWPTPTRARRRGVTSPGARVEARGTAGRREPLPRGRGARVGGGLPGRDPRRASPAPDRLR